MRIRNLENFLECPPGTIFSKYTPHIFGDLSIKGESLSGTEDFLYIPICDSINADNSEDFWRILERASETVESLPLKFDTIMRDGMFKSDQLFAVWEEEDIDRFIKVLLKAKESHPVVPIYHGETGRTTMWPASKDLPSDRWYFVNITKLQEPSVPTD